MVQAIDAFSGISVNDLAVAQQFYGQTLGLELDNDDMGLTYKLPGGNTVFLYDKPDHTSATFTVLNFVVEDIDAAVDDLVSKGVSFEHYEQMQQDEKDIARGKSVNMGPDIAWFKDPAGNILSVLQN